MFHDEISSIAWHRLAVRAEIITRTIPVLKSTTTALMKLGHGHGIRGFGSKRATGKKIR
jgi:hypothetical protein